MLIFQPETIWNESTCRLVNMWSSVEIEYIISFFSMTLFTWKVPHALKTLILKIHQVNINNRKWRKKILGQNLQRKTYYFSLGAKLQEKKSQKKLLITIWSLKFHIHNFLGHLLISDRSEFRCVNLCRYWTGT